MNTADLQVRGHMHTVHNLRYAWVSIICLSVLLVASLVSAQPADPGDAARFRFGPLRFTPWIAVTDIGVDNNVFNELDNRKSDTTMAVGPATDLWLRLGPSRLSGKVSGQYLYFQKYRNQRGWNTSDEGKWEVLMGRLTPFIAGSYTDTNQRPGYEIDARARQRAESASAGASLRLSAKTSLIANGRRTRVLFDSDQKFLGVDLAGALNRSTDSIQTQIRYQMTPLTTLIASGEVLQDRFTGNSIRNADSIKVLPGFELKPSALISGTIFVGYRRFVPKDRAVPAYQGVISAVDAKYLLGATQFGIRVARDLSYSFEPIHPYFGVTDVGLSLTQRVTHSWDVIGRGGWQRLAYRPLHSTAAAPLLSDAGEPSLDQSAQRTDHVYLTGLGLAYRVGQTMRLGFDANYYRRRSPAATVRDYDGLRMGASVTYGIVQ